MNFVEYNEKYKEELLDNVTKSWDKVIPYLTDAIEKAGKTLFPKVIIAFEDGKMVGSYCLYEKEFIISHNDITPWLGTVLIFKDCRGKGFSPFLIQDACERVKELGFEKIYLCTEHTNYYEKYGFVQFGTDVFKWGEATKLYEKKL